MPRKLVIDSDSFINFFRYYSFDKDENGIINEKLIGFIISKIENNEILVIDKVFAELRSPENKNFKEQIQKYVYHTENLLNKIEPLFKEFSIKSRIDFLNDEIYVQSEFHYYLEKYADLYLIALCDELKKQYHDIVLVTDETIKKDKKIVEKIPTICERKKIECRNLPYMLFTIYKNELIFDLKIQNN